MFREVKSNKEEQWRARLARFQSSGMTVVEFCERERISSPSFYQWRKRLAAPNKGNSVSPTFVPVRLTPLASPVEIHLPNGARVCVPAGDVVALRIAVEVAGQLNGGEESEGRPC